MNMYIVRHGETDWNLKGLVQGRADNPLNTRGIQQAKAMGEVFNGHIFECVITSPLCRTKETAAYLCHKAIVKSQRTDERIIEKSFGICDGIPIAQRYERYPYGHAPGEESFKVVRKRMSEAIREYASTYHDDILIVTHGCAIAALLKELDPAFEQQFIRLKNTSITVVNQELKVLAVDMSLDDVKNWTR